MSNNKALPLKLKNQDGALQQISSAEKNFVAYLVGLHNGSADSSDVGLLTTTAAGNRSLGSLTDTYYPEPVGTHPYDQSSVVTTTTNLYQINGTASETDSDFRRPVAHYGTNVYELNDTDMNTFVDDLNSRIALSDYPGSLKLSSTRPSADYDILVPNILVDQRADSADGVFTVNKYSIWRRTSMSAPISILDDDSLVSNLVGIKRSNGDSGDYQGLERLTDRQLQVSLGQRAKTRRAIADNVGSYELRTSSQGAPSTGTWKNVGSAVNTIRLVDEQNYTRTRVSAYTRDRVSTYTRNSTSTFTRDFIGEYTRTSTRDFIGNYTRDYIGNYTGDFTGDYTRDFIGNYSRTFAGDYVGNYSRSFVGNYSRNFTRTSTRTRFSAYSRTRVSNYSRAFTGNYSRNFTGNFLGEYARNYTGDFIGNYSRNYTRTRFSAYARFRVGTGSTYSRTFTRFENTYTATYAGPPGQPPFPEGGPIIQYPQISTGPDYIGAPYPITRTSNYADFFTRTEDVSFLRTVPDPTSPFGFRYESRDSTFIGNYAGEFARYYTRQFVGNYSREFTRTRNQDFARNFTRTSTRTSSREYLRDRLSTYSRNFTGNYSRGFAGDYVGEYSRNYTRERFSAYTRTSTRDRFSAYSRTRNSNYTRNSTSTFSRTRTSAYTRTRSSNYVGNYSRTRTSSYIGDFTGNYSRSFAGNYSRGFVGDYIGQTIGNTVYNVETYTLYVRTA